MSVGVFAQPLVWHQGVNTLPDGRTVTACGVIQREGARPRITLTPERVTCKRCLRSVMLKALLVERALADPTSFRPGAENARFACFSHGIPGKAAVHGRVVAPTDLSYWQNVCSLTDWEGVSELITASHPTITCQECLARIVEDALVQSQARERIEAVAERVRTVYTKPSSR